MPEPEGEAEDEVWVTVVVAWFVEFMESSGVVRGRALVGAARWEDVDVSVDVDVDVVVRPLVEDEEDEESVRVVVGAVVAVSDNLVVVDVPTLVLVVGAPGLKTRERKDSTGLGFRCWRFTRARSTGGMNMIVSSVQR